MPAISMPDGLEETENLPRTRRSLTNIFNDGEGRLVGRPGIAEINSDTTRQARANFVWNGSMYHVATSDLIKITDTVTGAFSVVGTVALGAEELPIVVAVGFNTAVIVVPGGSIYTLDKSDVLTDISGNSNFVACNSVAHINGRFVYVPSDGDPAFFSDVGAAGTVNVLSFFDAEELPDLNNNVFNFDNTLYICGTDSLELFRDTGASPNPFGRVEGARISNGFVGGLIEYNDTFLFIGREKGQGFGIYAVAQGLAPKISNEAVDLILASYPPSQLAAATGNRFKWRSRDVAVFTLARHTLGFYGGRWFLLDTLTAGTAGLWQCGYIAQFEGTYYTAYASKIGKLSKVNTDYGSSISRIIETGFSDEDGDYFTCQSIALGISQGFLTDDNSNANDDSKTVGLSVSRNNVEFGPMIYREVGLIGEYDKHLEWNEMGGLGTFNGFMGVRIKTTQNVDLSADKMSAHFR